MSVFERTSPFLFKCIEILQDHYTQFPYIFLAHAFSALDKRIPSMLTLPGVQVKIYQISHVFFQQTSQFFFKFFMTLKCHERLLLRTS